VVQLGGCGGWGRARVTDAHVVKGQHDWSESGTAAVGGKERSLSLPVLLCIKLSLAVWLHGIPTNICVVDELSQTIDTPLFMADYKVFFLVQLY